MTEDEEDEFEGLKQAGCRYKFVEFPSCHPLGISHEVSIPKELRGSGVGTRFHELRLREALDSGYKYLLCTVRSDNPPQLAIMKKFYWKELDRFHNSECDSHDTILFGRQM